MSKSTGVPKPIDWKVVDALLQYKPTLSMVAGYIDCSDTHLENKIKETWGMKFSEYREAKMAGMKLKLVQKAIDMGLKGNATMLIFCLKNLCDWSDKQEVSLGDDTSIEVHVK